MYSSIRHPERPLLRFLRSQQPLPYSPPLVKALGNGRPLLPKEARVVNRQAGGHARFNKSFPRTILRSCLPAFLPSVLPHAILTLGSQPLSPSLPLPTLVRFSRLSGLSATHPHLSFKKNSHKKKTGRHAAREWDFAKPQDAGKPSWSWLALFIPKEIIWFAMAFYMRWFGWLFFFFFFVFLLTSIFSFYRYYLHLPLATIRHGVSLYRHQGRSLDERRLIALDKKKSGFGTVHKSA